LLPLLLEMTGLPSVVNTYLFLEFADAGHSSNLIVKGLDSNHVLLIMLALFLVVKNPVRTFREINTK
jgi:hypothetical protein